MNHSQLFNKLPLVCIVSGIAIGLLAATSLGSSLLTSSVKKPKKIKLLYFDIKGKGEPIRMLCSYANYPLEDYRFQSREEFLHLKNSGQLTFGQVPALVINDGETMICQTNAIMRYLGKLTGTYPSCPIKAALVDSIMDQEADMFSGLSISKYSDRFGYSVLTEENIKVIRKELNDKILPTHLGFLEKLLKNSTSGYIADTSEPCICDFVLVPRLEFLVSGDTVGISKDLFKNFPLVEAYILKFKSNPKIQAYHLMASK